nr:MAG TPA: hypothetical protein [Caudoviricetes sp.]
MCMGVFYFTKILYSKFSLAPWACGRKVGLCNA